MLRANERKLELLQHHVNHNRLTISSKMSPALKASPSAFFQPAIPPSVMVGDMAGIRNELEAYLTTTSSTKAISQML